MLTYAENIEQVLNVMKPMPLTPEELPQFYVDVDAARDAMLFSAAVIERKLRGTPNLKLLFAGHTGSGKSTELNRLQQRIQESFLVVKFSAQDKLDLFNMEYVDLIMVMMESLFAVGRDNKLVKDEKLLKDIRAWLAEVTEMRVTSRGLEGEVAGGIETGDALMKTLLGIFVNISSAFKLSSSFSREIKLTLHQRVSELKGFCNNLITEVGKNLKRRDGRELLIVVEDLDKLDEEIARQIFVEHANILSELAVRIIYTAPIFLIHSSDRKRLEVKFEPFTLPMIKTRNRDGAVFTEGVNALKGIVHKRMDLRLIAPDALDLAIVKSGGVLRDLLEAIETAATVAFFKKAPTISTEAIKYALNKIKSSYRVGVQGTEEVSTEELYTELGKIATSPVKQFPMTERLTRLLYTQAVVEYNGDIWYDVHPLMRDALDEMGLLPKVLE